MTRSDYGDGRSELHVRLDIDDAAELGPIINKALVRAGAQPLSDAEIGRLATTITRTDAPRLDFQISLDVNHYRRGLIKIIYEITCLWLGDQYLDDPTAITIRACMLDDELPFDIATKYNIRGKMPFLAPDPVMPFWRDEPNALIGAALRNQEGALGVYVRVLGVFDALLIVTENLRAYSGFKQQFVCTDPVTRETRQSTFDEEIARMCSDGAAADQLSETLRQYADR